MLGFYEKRYKFDMVHYDTVAAKWFLIIPEGLQKHIAPMFRPIEQEPPDYWIRFEKLADATKLAAGGPKENLIYISRFKLMEIE